MRSPAAWGCTRRFLAATCLIVVASACAVRRTEFAAPVELPESFGATGLDVLPERWWEAFDDPRLDNLVAQALHGNFSFQTTWDRLAQAEAIGRIAGADLYPQADGRAFGGYSWGGIDGRTRSAHDFLLGLNVSYEVDLWGRIRSRRDAAALDVEASREDVTAAAISLTAAVAETWYRLAEARELDRVLREQVDTNERVLELITLRFRRGLSTAADVFRQRQLVEGTRGGVILAEAASEVLAHQLAVLVGEPPGAPVPVDEAVLIDLPPLPATGVPAALIHNRPDVRRAYLSVQAADRRVAEAIADRFPRVALTATGDASADSLRDLFDNWIVTIGANLVQPIIDGGRRRAEVARTRGVLSEAFHGYGQTVLDTLLEVEDALTLEARQAEFLASLTQQLATAQQVINRTRDSYRKGQLDYLRVLDALTSRQALQREYVVALREQISFRIDLSRAIATGIPLERPELARLEPPADDASAAAEESGGSTLP
jgi:NodT family efflux transporter outer membrane factor (OMF) lipoprotein